MEPVTISLNTDKQPMFFLPGKLHLTFENPGPIEVDPSTFTEQEKAWITQAHKMKVLLVNNPNKDVVSKHEPENAERPGARIPINPDPVISATRAESIKKVKALLSGKVESVKKAIVASDDILLLRLMKDAEAEGKKRISIFDALNTRLGEVQTNLVHDLGGDQGELGQLVTDPSLRNLPTVEEVMEKTITIRPLNENDE